MRCKPSYLLVIMLVSLLAGSCKKAEEIEYDTSWPLVNEEIFHVMTEWYYWNTTLPDDADMSQYSTPQLAMNSLMYTSIDRWSFVETKEEYEAYFYASAAIAYGFSLGQNAGGQMAVSYVAEGSPAEEAGLSRGCIVTKINGSNPSTIPDLASLAPKAEGESISLVYKDAAGSTHSQVIASRSIPVETVSYYDVMVKDGITYGYIIINSFVESTPSEIYQAFTSFKSQGVTRLIIDLRYNGGGLLSGSEYLTELIAPSSAAGRLMYSLKYNDNMADYNSSYYFQATSPLDLDKIFFLTSRNTASASEMVINCIKPYKDVIQIGTTTHGKPVGMGTYFYDDYAISPIMFAIENASGEGYYYSGIAPDLAVADDYATALGDADEPLLNAALNYDSLSATKSAAAPTGTEKTIDFRGFRSCLNMY